MQGYLCLVLHAHLPFVRHPEHEHFLEENWLFEAITETYIPLLRTVQQWQQDGMRSRLALTLTPTLCAMLRDPLLQSRYRQYLDQAITLAEKEVHRTHWERPLQGLATLYHERFTQTRSFYDRCDGDLIGALRSLQEQGQLEILTSAATHALLPLLANHPPSVRAQVLVGRDQYRECFGCDPRGIWLPECAYFEGLDQVLQEANLRWFIVDTHGLLHARPRPRFGIFAPIFTPRGVAVFGRDLDSAKQVWSRNEGYPGDPRYRDFYRDIGFDLDLEYLRPHLAAPEQRTFTGIKYYRITAKEPAKQVYDRRSALQAADEHAAHFLSARLEQVRRLTQILDRPPVIVCPYDAELFGHWWYEGPEFLDLLVRKSCFDQEQFRLAAPEDFLRSFPTHQVASPAPSSWGEEGYYRMWLNEANQWIYPHLQVAQERMSELVRRFSGPGLSASGPGAPLPPALLERLLKQAGRELLLAQASDWPFILRTGTSPEYARRRVNDHLHRFGLLHSQALGGQIDEPLLERFEAADNLFPNLNVEYWR